MSVCGSVINLKVSNFFDLHSSVKQQALVLQFSLGYRQYTIPVCIETKISSIATTIPANKTELVGDGVNADIGKFNISSNNCVLEKDAFQKLGSNAV